MEDNLVIDEKLWFILKDSECKGKHYIIGNPHTFHGRISGYCIEKKQEFAFSISEIESMSLESEYWIKGYLFGNEPKPPTDEEGDDLPFESEEMKHWWNSIKFFHQTGNWYSGERNCEICGKKLLNAWVGFECEKCIKK